MFSLTRLCQRQRRRDVRRLLQIPAFHNGDPRRLAELLPHTDHLRVPPGRTLVRSGEIARELIAIVAGEAAALSPNGNVAVLRPGAAIGGREVLGHESHGATIVAMSGLEVVVVNGPAVRWAHQQGVGLTDSAHDVITEDDHTPLSGHPEPEDGEPAVPVLSAAGR